MPAPRSAPITIAADGVGLVSCLLGGLLVVAPQRRGGWLGMAATSDRRRRSLGTADIALGVTILAGRAKPWRWRAVAARSALHLVFAREYARGGRASAAAGMGALFVVDAGIAAALRVAISRARPGAP